MICLKSSASVDGLPQQYDRVSISISAPLILIWRLDPPLPPPTDRQIARRGPHFALNFSQPLMWPAFARRHSSFALEGTEVGLMNERNDREGTYTHGVNRYELAVEVKPNDELMSLDFSGSLVETRQPIEGWPIPQRRDSFKIKLVISLNDAAELFHGASEPQEHIAKYLARHPDT